MCGLYSTVYSTSKKGAWDVILLADPIPRYFLFIQLDSQSRLVRRSHLATADFDRLCEQVVLVSQRTEDVAWKLFRANTQRWRRDIFRRFAQSVHLPQDAWSVQHRFSTISPGRGEFSSTC